MTSGTIIIILLALALFSFIYDWGLESFFIIAALVVWVVWSDDYNIIKEDVKDVKTIEELQDVPIYKESNTWYSQIVMDGNDILVGDRYVIKSEKIEGDISYTLKEITFDGYDGLTTICKTLHSKHNSLQDMIEYFEETAKSKQKKNEELEPYKW